MTAASAQPLITVIIPAYNSEKFIARAIESAISQVGVNIEVVVSDDASTDGTVELLRDMTDREPRLRCLMSKRNGGPGSARNVAIDAARGDWIALLDADDVFLPGRLARLLKVAVEHDADMVAENWRNYHVAEDRVSEPALRTSPKYEVLDRYAYLAGARPYNHEPDLGLLQPMISARFLRDHTIRYPAGVRHGEDFEFILKCLYNNARYVLDREHSGYLYTTRASGWSRTLIDYSGMIGRAKLLLSDVEVRHDPAARKLIRQRIEALQRLEVARLWSQPKALRPWMRVLQRMTSSAGGRRWFLDRVHDRILRVVGETVE